MSVVIKRVDCIKIASNTCVNIHTPEGEMYTYTFKGNNSASHFHFYLPSERRSTLTGKNLLPQEQILSLKSRPHLGRASSSRVGSLVVLGLTAL